MKSLSKSMFISFNCCSLCTKLIPLEPEPFFGFTIIGKSIFFNLKSFSEIDLGQGIPFFSQKIFNSFLFLDKLKNFKFGKENLKFLLPNLLMYFRNFKKNLIKKI